MILDLCLEKKKPIFLTSCVSISTTARPVAFPFKSFLYSRLPIVLKTFNSFSSKQRKLEENSSLRETLLDSHLSLQSFHEQPWIKGLKRKPFQQWSLNGEGNVGGYKFLYFKVGHTGSFLWKSVWHLTAVFV